MLLVERDYTDLKWLLTGTLWTESMYNVAIAAFLFYSLGMPYEWLQIWLEFVDIKKEILFKLLSRISLRVTAAILSFHPGD